MQFKVQISSSFRLEKAKGCKVGERLCWDYSVSSGLWNWCQSPSLMKGVNEFPTLYALIGQVSRQDNKESWRWLGN
ncbi:hypothetical protein HanXRQr2_Chr13g0588781 [Helianthus annuus]|uniref:Uncharacterized protein n=1 Tax=Helianthus annuus TaxID=4232 RepID=A0A9K3HAW2_HELAN|nr:hypothetical protein HanXRQr2_Chr13g0588781 [Helianthus annuus]KAJ0849286.1 hypothetical protein HanPSC8_Chr13g0567071 [Helianthus annuus]